MSAERRALAGAGAGAARSVAVIVALGVEHASLRARLAGAGLNLLQSGPGPERAAGAAVAALAAGADALVSCGFAGGLEPRLRPGAVIVPRRVTTPEGASYDTDPAWRSAAVQALGAQLAVSEGDLLGVPAALLTSAAKLAAAATYGAAAADMESAAIAAIAARAGAPFLALRVIIDTAADALPADAESWIDERGNRRAAAALGAVLRPAQWRSLWTLGLRYRSALRVLEQIAALAAASRFFAAPASRAR
jgi:adenosylhomocysteine nucleosidase